MSQITVQNDELELTSFVRAASRRVRSALAQRGLCQIEIQDCSQDVLIQVIKRWPQLRRYPLGARHGYLRAVSRGVAVAWFRRSRCHRAVFTDGLTEENPDPGHSNCPEAAYAAQGLRSAIEACLANSDPATRVTFELVCLGHTEAEVASMQCVPLGTVASRLRRIRSRLRRVLLDK